MSPKHDKQSLSRRTFLKQSLVAAAAIAGAPMLVPSSALGRDGAVAPSNRITIGLVGMGILGRTAHLAYLLDQKQLQVLAVCDCDREKLDASRKMIEDAYADRYDKASWKGCQATGEFRDVTGRADLDAIFVVTPDNWHSIVALAAIRAGKDVYCEKPMAHTIAEARAVADAARRFGTVFQTGSQQRSDKSFRQACELVRNGRIGRVHTVHVNVGGPARECELPGQPVPAALDWDRWLGPAPWRPFNAILAPPVTDPNFPDWRSFSDYAAGGQADFGAHHYDIAQWGLGMDDSGPVEIFPPDGKEYQTLTYKYASGVVMTRGGAPDDTAVEFIGDKGWVRVNRGDFLKTEPASLVHETFGRDEIHLIKSDSHHDNFFEAMRTRRPTICTAEIGCRSATVCYLGVIAEQLGRPLHWDPAAERFENDEEANKLRSRPMRAPWMI